MVISSLYRDVVPPKGLEALKHYRYASIDKSPVANYIMQPYWRWAVNLFPMWMAPNLITFLGFLFVVSNIPLILYFVPDFETEGPYWIYFSFAAGLWLYSTFDNVDGKQARRTNSSSPLGEIFDHGVDALNCTFGGILQSAGVAMGLTWRPLLVIFMACSTFFFSTWETYHTGMLYLGYINGPTEGLIIINVCLIISGIYGPRIWWTKLSDIASLPYISESYPDLAVLDFSIIMLVGLMLFTQIPVSIIRVRDACRAKKTSFAQAMFQVVPYLMMSFFAYLWTMSPKSIVVSQCLLVFLSAWGFAFGRIAASIILRHVTHLPYPDYTFLLGLFGCGAMFVRIGEYYPALDIWTPEREYALVWVLFGLILTEYSFWVSRVISQFCSHLGIECFRIPTPSTLGETGKKHEEIMTVEQLAKLVKTGQKRQDQESSEKNDKSAAATTGLNTPTRRSARLRGVASSSSS